MPNIDNFTIDDGSVKWKFRLLTNENTSSGENNKIESISVDGVRQSIDNNKNVNITLNTKYATKDELDDYVKSSELSGITGGDINKIENVSVNGNDLPINNKRVNIDLNDYAKKTDINKSINNIPNASSITDGLMSKEDKERLDGLITTGGEANKIENVAVNGTDLTITDKRVNINLSEYAKKSDLNDYATVDQLVENIPTASSTEDGLMSKEDKDRLDNLVTTGGEANKINSISVDGVNQTIDSNKNVNISLSDYAKKTDVTASINDIPNANTSKDGLMSKEDKAKLDDIDTSVYATKDDLDDYVKNSDLDDLIIDYNNKIENVAVNGTDLVINDKRVNIPAFDGVTSGVVTPNTPSGGNTKYLREDGTWQIPENTIYELATSTTNGLMSSIDKERLDNLYFDSSKLNGYITLNNKEDVLLFKDYTKELEIVQASGEISNIYTKDETVATVTLNENTITINGIGVGNTELVIVAAASTEHKQYALVVPIECIAYSLDIFAYPDINTFNDLQSIIRRGLADHYLMPGSYFDITMADTVALEDDTSIAAGSTWRAICLGLNHNPELEGYNTAHFCICKNTDNEGIVFYKKEMNPTAPATGGWEASEMRRFLNNEYLAALPILLQNVISTCDKWTDNNGYNNKETDVTVTRDKIWLLSDYEYIKKIHENTGIGVNNYQYNYQQQYELFALGNSWNSRDHTKSLEFGCTSMTRTVRTNWNSIELNRNFLHITNASGHFSVDTQGHLYYGFAPCFSIA